MTVPGLILTILFGALKITHNVDWSWLTVLLPVTIGAGIDVVIGFLMAIAAALGFRGLSKKF